MKNNIKENQKNNTFTITWISGVSLLLLICVFGFSSTSFVKGTSAVENASSSSSSSSTVSACWDCDKVYKTGTYVQMQNQCGTFTRVADSYCNNSSSSSQQAQCYQCNSAANEFHWGVNTGNASYNCGGGWHLRTDLTQSTCKSSGTSSSSPTVSACWECDKVYKTGTYAQMQNQCGTFTRVENSFCNNSPSSSSSKPSSSSSSSGSSKCYCWDTEDGQTCKKLTTAPGGSYTIEDDSKCSSSPSSSSQKAQCYQCNSAANEFHWGVNTSNASYNCGGGWHLRTDLTQSTCKSSEQKAQCYQCNSAANEFHWGVNTSNASYNCGGGWHLRTDLTQSTCKSSEQQSKKVYLSYNPNGGKIVDNRSGGADVCAGQTTTCSSGDSCTIASGANNCKVTINLSAERPGYVFKGWAYSSNATVGVTGWTNISSNATMYAVWERCADCDDGDCSSSSSSKPSSSSVRPGSSSNKPSSSSIRPGSSSNKPSSSSNVSKPTSSSSSKAPIPSYDNVDENPKTGQIFIFVIWVVALAAIVYSVWYFRKMKEANGEQ